ncbi:MAG: TMEM143 family protein [Hyphomicrobiaceae bacterium]
MATAQTADGLGGRLPGGGGSRQAPLARDPAPAAAPSTAAADAKPGETERPDIFASEDSREKFLPVTPQALMDRLSRPDAWPNGMSADVRRLFMYMAYWRQQSYGAKLLELGRAYEPFSPDSDLLVTRKYSDEEKRRLERQLVEGVRGLMQQANYTRIDPRDVDIILTKDSHYGLDLHVDLAAFDEIEIYYRGATTRKETRRSRKKFYLRNEEFDLPVFQRLAIVFKLKPESKRVDEIMAQARVDRATAERRVRRMRGPLTDRINPEFIYIKLFKNIPRADLEMVFPNTRIRFRLFDKIKLGVTASGGLGMGVAGTLTKVAVATNPIALAGAVFGLGGVAARQVVAFINQRNKYMVTMAQNLYSHALADNRGVMTLLAERAAEEDVKEEILLYSLLAKERVHVSELPLADKAIEGYLASTFGFDANFDVEDALQRLKADGIVRETPDGWLEALPPDRAALHIDSLWDSYLDDLAELTSVEGSEYEGESPKGLT